MIDPNSEFLKDILRTLLAKEHYKGDQFIFLCGPRSKKACSRPAQRAILDWVYAKHGVRIDVYDIEEVSEAALSGEDDQD